MPYTSMCPDHHHEFDNILKKFFKAEDWLFSLAHADLKESERQKIEGYVRQAIDRWNEILASDFRKHNFGFIDTDRPERKKKT